MRCPGKMKLAIYACLTVLISCTQVIMSSSDVVGNSSSIEREGPMQETKVGERLGIAVNGRVETLQGVVGDRKLGNYDGKQETIYESGKSQRGKTGAYGGANIAHRPRPIEKNAASTLLAAPPSFVSSTFLAYLISLGNFILVPPFELLQG